MKAEGGKMSGREWRRLSDNTQLTQRAGAGMEEHGAVLGGLFGATRHH